MLLSGSCTHVSGQWFDNSPLVFSSQWPYPSLQATFLWGFQWAGVNRLCVCNDCMKLMNASTLTPPSLLSSSSSSNLCTQTKVSGAARLRNHTRSTNCSGNWRKRIVDYFRGWNVWNKHPRQAARTVCEELYEPQFVLSVFNASVFRVKHQLWKQQEFRFSEDVFKDQSEVFILVDNLSYSLCGLIKQWTKIKKSQ